jgi:hypothetical protein
VATQVGAEAKRDPPKSEVCELAKAKRRDKKDETTTKNPKRDWAIKADHLGPGLRLYVDHFERRQRGLTWDSYDKATAKQYATGCIFVDHAAIVWLLIVRNIV